MQASGRIYFGFFISLPLAILLIGGCDKRIPGPFPDGLPSETSQMLEKRIAQAEALEQEFKKTADHTKVPDSDRLTAQPDLLLDFRKTDVQGAGKFKPNEKKNAELFWPDFLLTFKEEGQLSRWKFFKLARELIDNDGKMDPDLAATMSEASQKQRWEEIQHKLIVLGNLSHVVMVRTRKEVLPATPTGTGELSSGFVAADAYLYRLEDAKLIGGFRFEARNKIRSHDAKLKANEQPNETEMSALRMGMRVTAEEIMFNQLGRFVKTRTPYRQ
jgi:hypothetical protein